MCGTTTARDRGGQTRFGAALLGHAEPSLDLVEHRESFGPLLSELSDRKRTMRFFGGLTQTEIGHQVGISQMHVWGLLTRTLARLRRRLTVGTGVKANHT